MYGLPTHFLLSLFATEVTEFVILYKEAVL